jgi:phosphoribosyl-ATP pyrophosphohydrolase/phosphoribosyl-AMP cyclohydrolase
MKLNFSKNNGLLPAIIQDVRTAKVLMLGFMNEEALEKTRQDKKVTFFSRSRQKLWTKGETSGNFLLVDEILLDCDQDTILIKVKPTGPVCHTGQDTCFNESNTSAGNFLSELESIIQGRKTNMPAGSYTTKLFSEGINKIAQKVGEEATETIIEAMDGNNAKLKEETADLFYHLLVLLVEKGVSLRDVEDVLIKRHRK